MPDLPPYLSISQVTTYLQCPRKFMFRYVEHLEPEFRAPELALGSAVHATIAWWLEERLAGREVSKEAIDRTFRVDWFNEGLGQRLNVESPEAAGELASVGQGLVDLFARCFHVETLGQGAKVEKRFEVELVDPSGRRALRVPLVGYYDFVDPQLIGEIKTASRKVSPKNWELQLAAYSYARERETGTRRKVRLIELVKTKEPQIEVIDLAVPNRDVAWMLEVTSGAYASMRAGAFHPSPTFMCTRCEYKSACRRTP